MAKFRKKPVVIEAVQYGPYSMPTVELAGFLEGVHCSIGSDGLVIETLEGNMLAGVGDWIIKGVNGEFYPCKPDIFEKTYEAVEEGSESSPEQPSYKHPEKDIFNPSEDDGWDVAAEADEDLPTAEDVCGILAEDSTEKMIESDDPFDGVTGQFPLESAAEFKAADFMGFTVTEKELPEGVLAEAVSANGEKVVITE